LVVGNRLLDFVDSSVRRLLQLQLTRRRPRLLRWWSLFFSRFSKMRMNEFFYRKERERCVCVCVCVCVSNARARDYNFEEEIDLLFFEHSRSRETTKYAKEKKRKKKQTFSSNKNTRPMTLRRRQSHRLLFLFYLFLLLVSFLLLPSCLNAQEEEGKCPLDIAKIDLSGLGNACNADDPGTFFISLFLHV